MSTLISDHISRVRAAVKGTYGLATLNNYITEKTFLNGKRYSFKGHEFQLEIGNTDSREDITVKCAQVGVSEYYYRWALAACRNIENFTIIYTFPNASDAAQMCVTRINPIIDNSPDLKLQVDPDVNNTSLKQFGKNSFFYMRGTRSEAGAISVPADCIINDEWDKSDIDIATMYVARLQHKPYKLWKKFSTPTVNKYGILLEAETARRFKHLATCSKCNHTWLPSYFDDVKIPGYDGSLKDLNKFNLKNYNFKEALLLCPRCGRPPEPTMSWVQENINDNYVAKARFISPFSAPEIIHLPDLIHSSTLYKKYSEFMNQGLGLAAEDDDETITEEDLDACFLEGDLTSSDLHVFASDMGVTCRAVVGRLASDGTTIVVHKEEIELRDYEKRRKELIAKYRCCLSVHDTMPYADLITRITEYDLNAYGALFANFKSGPTYRLEEQEADPEAGKLNLRQIKIRRNLALDEVMHLIKSRRLKVQKCALDDVFKQQLQSLKKIQKYDENGDLCYTWEKTGNGYDHFHFALLYLHTGITFRALSVGTNSIIAKLPILQALKRPAAFNRPEATTRSPFGELVIRRIAGKE